MPQLLESDRSVRRECHRKHGHFRMLPFTGLEIELSIAKFLDVSHHFKLGSIIKDIKKSECSLIFSEQDLNGVLIDIL
jgi:hypothetical protein